jgi:hypothetical protein
MIRAPSLNSAESQSSNAPDAANTMLMIEIVLGAIPERVSAKAIFLTQPALRTAKGRRE